MSINEYQSVPIYSTAVPECTENFFFLRTDTFPFWGTVRFLVGGSESPKFHGFQ